MRILRDLKACALVTVVLLAAGCAERTVKPTLAPREQLVPAGGEQYCSGPEARLSSGALYRVCVIPERWNGDIIVYVPGYHDPARSPQLQDDITRSTITKLLLPLGYAFATTSFRGTGLIQPDWIEGDLLELVTTTKTLLTGMTGRTTRYVYQAGGSQGGLATVQALERHPEVFSGGLAGCGPCGDYAKQIEYVADFRVVFDEYFHDAIPNWPVWRQDLSAGDPGFVNPAAWHADEVATAISDPSNAGRLAEVLAVTQAPVDGADPASARATALSVLWYSFRGTNDAIAKLGGLPFGNVDRTYHGSTDDAALNAGVERFRFSADPTLLATLQTSARLRRPLVTMHTTGDPVVPIWHQQLYRSRLPLFERLLHIPITIRRYGHCNFTETEILAAFAVLVFRVSGVELAPPPSVLPQPAARAEFEALVERYGAQPELVP